MKLANKIAELIAGPYINQLVADADRNGLETAHRIVIDRMAPSKTRNEITDDIAAEKKRIDVWVAFVGGERYWK